MTEQEWLEEANPEILLLLLRGRVSDRKMRLLAVAACRTVWHMFSHAGSRRAVEVGEAFAVGTASERDRSNAEAAARSVADAAYRHWEAETEHVAAAGVRFWVASAALGVVSLTAATMERAVTEAGMALAWSEDATLAAGPHAWSGVELGWPWTNLVRDVVGNPCRPVTVDSAWLTSNVTSLATVIYDECAFDRLPILADALEDAGCTNTDILTHCRQPGEHVRGCWAVDAVLGKS